MREALNLALDRGPAGRRPRLSARRGHRRSRGVRPDRGAVDEVRPRPGVGHTDLGSRDRRRGDRGCDRRAAAGGRDHDHGFHRHRCRPADQQRRQTAIHDGRAYHRADHHPYSGVCGFGHWRHAFAESGGLVHAHPRDEGDRALHPTRRQRPADRGDLRRGPLPVRRNHSSAEQKGTRSRRTRVLNSARPGRHQASGHRRQS